MASAADTAPGGGVGIDAGTGSAAPGPDLARRPGLRRVDLIVLPLVFLADVLVFSRLLRAEGVSPAERAAILVSSGAGVALLMWRWRAPVTVFAATVALSVPPPLVGDFSVPYLVPLVALAAVAQLRSTRVSLTCLVTTVMLVGVLVGRAVMQASPEGKLTSAVGSTVFYTAGFVLAWAFGYLFGRHQRRLNQIRALHAIEVRRQREMAEHAVALERLRIARELHDIVAHSVTIMVLHAAGAQRVVRSDPDRAAESLATIESAGQQAMAELRRLLALLRESGEVASRAESTVPGLAQIDQLLDAARRSGVVVELETTGEPRRLDAGVDLAAYRLVQEAITNVTKHLGAGARVVVTLEWEPEKVTVSVEDDGIGMRADAPRAAEPGGHGLVGLRERVAIAAGDFSAGPTDAGGFRVAARLPVSTAPQAPGLPPQVPGPPRIPATADPMGGVDG